MTAIHRPEVAFDAAAHEYKVEGQDVLGVSSIAKIGGAEKTWQIASAHGFRIGYEGAFALASEHKALRPFCVEWVTKRGPASVTVDSQDNLREALKGRGLTPWAKRDRAAERGTFVHDLLEGLAQDNAVPTHYEIERMPASEQAHVRSVVKWYLHFRPEFVATEVQVASVKHGFAGRYDIRAFIEAKRLLKCIDPLRDDEQADRVRRLAGSGLRALCLIDLKTSKGIYPETHFPQLEGYEGAGVEMGFPVTDARCVLNTNEDGSFEPARDLAVSWATYEDFLAFGQALRAIRRIDAADPETKRRRIRDEAIMGVLPALSREIAAMALPELAGLDSKGIGRILGALRRKGRVRQENGIWKEA